MPINASNLYARAMRVRTQLGSSLWTRHLYEGATAASAKRIVDFQGNNPDMRDIRVDDTKLIALEQLDIQNVTYIIRGFTVPRYQDGNAWTPDINKTYWLSKDNGATLNRVKLLTHRFESAGQQDAAYILFFSGVGD